MGRGKRKGLLTLGHLKTFRVVLPISVIKIGIITILENFSNCTMLCTNKTLQYVKDCQKSQCQMEYPEFVV